MNEMTRIAAQPAYSEGVQKLLKREPALFINGEWVKSTHDRTIPIHDPSTGREISAMVDASDADCDRAVAAARTAFDDGRWSGLAPYARQRMVEKLADLIEANTPELAELESVDNGKPRMASQGYDLPKCVQALRYMAGWATKLSGEHIEPSGMPSDSAGVPMSSARWMSFPRYRRSPTVTKPATRSSS